MKGEQFKEYFERRTQESNTTMFKQSTKVSSLGRYIIYVFIATIWMFSYEDGRFIIPSTYLAVTMAACLLYLLIDMVHYFIETCWHYKLGRFIYHSSNQKVEKVEPYINNQFLKINRFSFIMFVTKFIWCSVVSILFIINIVEMAIQ